MFGTGRLSVFVAAVAVAAVVAVVVAAAAGDVGPRAVAVGYKVDIALVDSGVEAAGVFVREDGTDRKTR